MHEQTIKDFFSALLGGEDKKVTFRFLRDKNKTGTNADASAGKYGTLSEALPAIRSRNADGWGIYFVVNHTGGAGTNDADVKHARALFIDIDDSYCPPVIPVEPSCILRRSDGNGYHVYWFLSVVENDLERWTAAQKALIHFYKSDKVIHNPARLMRIPGTVNNKETANGAMYEIQSLNDKRYTLSEVLAGHEGEDSRREQARGKIAAIFRDGEISDGEGRHKAFVNVAFILHDYGFSGSVAREEISRANEKYLRSTYTPEELDKFLDSQKYAKSEKGGAVADKAIAEAAKADRVRELVKDWFYVRDQDSFYTFDEPDKPISYAGFNAKFLYSTDCANPSKFMFSHDCIKQYEGFTYAPDAGEDVPRKKDGDFDRNTHIPSSLEPIEETPQWFLDHITYLIPNEVERNHFLDYFAYMVQNPGKRVNHGILVIGKQGIGKSILGSVFAQIFGAKNISTPHNENLSSQFTGWAKHARLVIINELLQTDKKDFINKIKPFITDETVEVREMYRAPYEIKNHMHFLAFSNHDNALYLDNEDRRWLVIQCPHDKREPEYYETLVDNIANRCGEVLHFFRSRDVSAFRPGAAPPMTAAKQAIVDYSKSDLEVWIEEGIESESAPFDSDFVTVADIRDALPMGQRNYATQNRIIKILRGLGAVVKDRVRVGSGQKRFWVVRNFEKYESEERFIEAVRKVHGSGETKDESGFVQ